MAMKVTGAFDGGNPQASSAIDCLSEDTFAVRPFSEKDTGNKFALKVLVRNDGPKHATVRLLIDWSDTGEVPDPNFVHVGSDDTWRYVPGVVDGRRSTVVFRAAPGDTYVGVCPEYGLGRYEQFAASLEGRMTSGCRETAGSSGEGRGIDVWRFGGGQKALFVIGRVHPWETSGSYCAEGLLQWLADQAEAGAGWLQDWRCAVMPMPNPDGVARGLWRHTSATGGADLEVEGPARAHAESVAIMDVLDELRPAGFLDIHGWLHYAEDGIHCSQERTREAFLAAAEATDGLRYNRWNGRYSAASPTGTRHTCMERFGATALAVSYAWPGRSADDMRAVGRSTFVAFLKTLGVG